MKMIPLGSQGLVVPVEGLGAMGMSVWYGPRDETESLETLNRAIDLGVTLIDTAEAYGPFENEILISKVLKNRRDEVIIASKFSTDFDEVSPTRKPNGSADHVRRATERSLKHLAVDTIDLYYIHRVDPDTPIEETVGALGELVKEGKIRYIGLSEASPETIRRAHAAFPITAVQSEYSLFERGVETNGVLDTVRELGIGFVAFSPLGRGFLSGKITSVDDLAVDDARRNLPRFSPENIAANNQVVEKLQKMASEKGVTASQLALAWVIAQGVVPIAGTKRRTFLEENAVAAEIKLTDDDLKRLDGIAPRGVASGERDTEAGLRATYR